ncbi:MAG: GNAT family N-acetyltransferase [Anaerolineae bacterium]|nr:GNAT family N-acetyltransferase [Anaerolineae bacterium]
MLRENIPDTLVTTYLEMNRRSAFRPVYLEDNGEFVVLRMETVDVPYYRYLYSAVGESWRWRDRLLVPESELHRALSDPNTTVDVLYVGGVPAGYIELVRGKEATEVAYFGLRPAYMGRGLGKHLLSWGVAHAWSDGAQRVWVHTCNLDGPYALENYLKRGFSVYNITEEPMPTRYF